MFVPVPWLVAIGVVMAVMVVAMVRGRSGGRRDLLAPPPSVSPGGRAEAMPHRAMAGNPPAATSGHVGQQPAGAARALTPDMAQAVRRLVERGEIVRAIKAVRDATGLGLRDSKDVVDGMASR